jgi:hypothetical protein
MNFRRMQVFVGKNFKPTSTGKVMGAIIVSGKKNGDSFDKPFFINTLFPEECAGKQVVSGFFTASEYKGIVQLSAVVQEIHKDDVEQDLPF